MRPQAKKCVEITRTQYINFSLSNLLKNYPFTYAKPLQNTNVTSIISYLCELKSLGSINFQTPSQYRKVKKANSQNYHLPSERAFFFPFFFYYN